VLAALGVSRRPASRTAFFGGQRKLPFDVVITDLGMPRVDGRTVAAAVKSIRRDARAATHRLGTADTR